MEASSDLKSVAEAMDPERGLTRIRPELRIKGKVTCKDNLVLEGRLEGDIRCEALVYVAGGGRVVGDIRAANVVIDGEVEGNIHAENRTELRPEGRVVGDIRTRKAKISEGSSFQGNLTVLGDEDRAEAGN